MVKKSVLWYTNVEYPFYFRQLQGLVDSLPALTTLHLNNNNILTLRFVSTLQKLVLFETIVLKLWLGELLQLRAASVFSHV